MMTDRGDDAVPESGVPDPIGRGDFLGTATDNRISVINDPDRWEGLQASDNEEPDDIVRASGEAENEDYRMFLTQRTQQPPTHQQQQQQLQTSGDTAAEAGEGEAQDEQEQYMEQLGRRLVLGGGSERQRSAAGDEEDNDEGESSDLTPRPPPQQQQQQQQTAPETAEDLPARRESKNFSVRLGGNQLADLLPSPSVVPTSHRQQHQQQPADQRPAPMPSVPQELYVGYLRLDSGHLVGPFRWHVDSVETPVSLEEGMSSRDFADQQRSSGLFSVLIDAAPGPDGARQRVTTRSGRLAFLDASAGNTGIGARPTEDARSALAALSSGLAALGSGSAPVARGSPQVDNQLTKLLAGALAANGASLMVACTNSAEATTQARGLARAPGREASTQAVPTSAEASVTARGDQQQPTTTSRPTEQEEQLSRLVKSLRQELESLRAENASMQSRLLRESSSAASPDKQHRPASKGSYQNLYEMLQEYMQENETLRNENLDLVKFQGEHRKEQDQLARENRRLAGRLHRMQRQQAAAAANKPLYVVSNPDSRASSNQQRVKQQPQHQASATVSLATGDSPSAAAADNESSSTSLPPIPAGADSAAARRQAFPTPPSGFSSGGASGTQPPPAAAVAQSPTQRLLRQQQQQMAQLQMQLQMQQQQQQMQHAFQYYQQPAAGHLPHQSVPQNPAQQQHHHSQRQPIFGTGQQQQQQHQYQQPGEAEKPLHVPKPGEKTYRGRFQQQQHNAPVQRHHPEANAHAVKDTNKLNDSLKSELRQLDGAIQQHQRVNALQSDIRRNEGRKVLRTF